MPVILKVLEGPDAGIAVRLNIGETVVGTGTRATLRLTTQTASVEHFVITQNEDVFTIENLSARGTMVNENKIAGKSRLRLRDKIRVSEDTVIRLETEGGDSLITQYRSLVIAFIVGVILLGLVLLIFDPFTTPPAKASWERTQGAMTRFVETNKRYPAELRRTWNAAWKKDNAAKSSNDYKLAAQEWLAVQVAILKFQTPLEKEELPPTTAQVKKLFDKLLRDERPDDFIENHPKEIEYVLLQFVDQRYSRAMRLADQASGLLD